MLLIINWLFLALINRNWFCNYFTYFIKYSILVEKIRILNPPYKPINYRRKINVTANFDFDLKSKDKHLALKAGRQTFQKFKSPILKKKKKRDLKPCLDHILTDMSPALGSTSLEDIHVTHREVVRHRNVAQPVLICVEVCRDIDQCEGVSISVEILYGDRRIK